jgi:hypothetical protein
LWVRPGTYSRVAPERCFTVVGSGLTANIRLGWKSLPRTRSSLLGKGLTYGCKIFIILATELHSKVGSHPCPQYLRWKYLAITNTLAYYVTKLITALKCFIKKVFGFNTHFSCHSTDGATTFSITTFDIMTYSITLRNFDTQHNDNAYAKCRIEVHYVECHYNECHYAECHGANRSKFQLERWRVKLFISHLFCLFIMIQHNTIPNTDNMIPKLSGYIIS